MWSYDHTLDLLGSVIFSLRCTLESLGGLRSHLRYSDLIGIRVALALGILSRFNAVLNVTFQASASPKEISASGA